MTLHIFCMNNIFVLLLVFEIWSIFFLGGGLRTEKKAQEYNNCDHNIVHLLRSTSLLKKHDLKYLRKNLGFYNTKITKSDYMSKTKNQTKKNHLCEKWASSQFKSTLQIWPRLKKFEFLGAQNARFGSPWRPNAIWCDMKLYAHNFF